jgi:hypothetical protein
MELHGVEDLTCEIMEELEADVVMERAAGLVGSRTIIASENAVKAFSVSYHPNLVSLLFPCAFLCLGSLLIVWVLLRFVFVAHSIVQLLLPPPPV